MLVDPKVATALVRRVLFDPRPHEVKRIRALAATGQAGSARPAFVDEDARHPPLPDVTPNNVLLTADTLSAIDAMMDQEMELLIKAMIAAAKADGVVDPQERQRIVHRLQVDGASDAQRHAVLRELDAPFEPEKLLRDLGDPTLRPELRSEIYATSLLTARLDNAAECDWLKRLAAALGLPMPEIERLHRQLGEPCPWARLAEPTTEGRHP